MVSLRIALRYLFSRRRTAAVNVISIVSMIGVGVATAAIVCVLSVFNGFHDLSYSRLSAVDPALRITAIKGKVLYNADSLATALKEISGVTAALPTIDDQVLATYHGRQMPVRMIGVTAAHDMVMGLRNLVVDGEYKPQYYPDSISCAALSVGVAARLGAQPGYYEWLGVYAPVRRGRINPANPMAAFTGDSLLVSAVYEALDADFDTHTIVVPLEVARRLFDYTTEATSVDLALSDGADADAVGKAVAEAVGPQYRVMTRLEQQQSSFRMIAVEKWITFAMLVFILLVASFNVVSTLSMIIIEKRSDITTLRAMGATRGLIRRIFVLEGWLISMVGALGGIITGVALVLAQQTGGFIKLGGDPSQLTISVYPVRLEWADLLIVFALTAVVGYLVGVITTLASSRR